MKRSTLFQVDDMLTSLLFFMLFLLNFEKFSKFTNNKPKLVLFLKSWRPEDFRRHQYKITDTGLDAAAVESSQCSVSNWHGSITGTVLKTTDY